jgi:sporulation protein YlmC with PRC-barrel domain
MPRTKSVKASPENGVKLGWICPCGVVCKPSAVLTLASHYVCMVHALRIASLVVAISVTVSAQSPRTAECDKLIGATVYAAKGIVVGQVWDVSTTVEGVVDALRVKTASPLGLGERIVVVHKGDFRILRNGILLAFSAGELDMFPSDSVQRGPSQRDEPPNDR